MSANHDLHLDLCAALTAGSIEPTDQRLLEEHLAGGCAECHALLRDLSASIEALALALPSAKPSRGLKARTLVAVAQAARGPAATTGLRVPEELPDGTPAGALRGARAWVWGAAAVLLLLAGAGWWRATSLAGRVDELTSLADVGARRAAFERAHPAARVLTLSPTKDGDPERRARVLYDPAARRAFVEFENFLAPAGTAFELWTVRDEKPYSEGLVEVGADGRGARLLENVGDPARLGAFAVSIEAPGGAADRRTPRTVCHRVGVP